MHIESKGAAQKTGVGTRKGLYLVEMAKLATRLVLATAMGNVLATIGFALVYLRAGSGWGFARALAVALLPSCLLMPVGLGYLRGSSRATSIRIASAMSAGCLAFVLVRRSVIEDTLLDWLGIPVFPGPIGMGFWTDSFLCVFLSGLIWCAIMYGLLRASFAAIDVRRYIVMSAVFCILLVAAHVWVYVLIEADSFARLSDHLSRGYRVGKWVGGYLRLTSWMLLFSICQAILADRLHDVVRP